MNNVLRIEHQGPQIRTILGADGKKYTIALPPITIANCYNHNTRTIGIFHKSENNLSELFPIQPCGFSKENLWDDSFILYDYFDLHQNLTISSLQQWHDLTQQNPQSLQKYRYKNNASNLQYLSENHCFLIPDWIAHEKQFQILNENIKIFQNTNRSVFCNQMPCHLSLPEIALVQIPDRKIYLCLMHTKDQSYIPLTLPNVQPAGDVCLGLAWIDCAGAFFDYFWNSSFMNSMFEIKINPNLPIKSLGNWEILTVQDPHFLQKHLDPNFMERNSPILYNLHQQKNQSILSWTIRR